MRRFFVFHAAVDLLVGLPLMVAPHRLLGALGWTAVDPAAARLVAAALLAIGLQSLAARNAGPETYRVLLDLKLLWSAGAIVALILGIGDGAPSACWALLALYVAFLGVWSHYRIRMKQMRRADELDDSQPRDEDDEPA